MAMKGWIQVGEPWTRKYSKWGLGRAQFSRPLESGIHGPTNLNHYPVGLSVKLTGVSYPARRNNNVIITSKLRRDVWRNNDVIITWWVSWVDV